MNIIFYTPGRGFDKRKHVVTTTKKTRYNNFTFGISVAYVKKYKKHEG